MAPFVDLLFTFQKRFHPHSLASFATEDQISLNYLQPGLKVLGRSGIRIQHCFNVLGIEPRDGRWYPRQIAAYHSYDLLENRATWIVVKGDNTIRHRLQRATSEALKSCPDFPRSRSSSFAQTLADHLLTCQWSAEQWSAYLQSIEDEYRRLSAVTKFGGVDNLARDVAVRRTMESNPSRPETSTDDKTGTQTTPGRPSFIRVISSRITERALVSTGRPARQTTGLSTRSGARQSPLRNKNLKMEDVATFQNFQQLRELAVEIQERLSMIEQTVKVLEKLKSRYCRLTRDPRFTQHLSSEDVGEFQEHADEHSECVQIVMDRLMSFQERLRTIHSWMEHAGEVVSGHSPIAKFHDASNQAHTQGTSVQSYISDTEYLHRRTLRSDVPGLGAADGDLDRANAPEDHVDACHHHLHTHIPPRNICSSGFCSKTILEVLEQ